MDQASRGATRVPDRRIRAPSPSQSRTARPPYWSVCRAPRPHKDQTPPCEFSPRQDLPQGRMATTTHQALERALLTAIAHQHLSGVLEVFHCLQGKIQMHTMFFRPRCGGAHELDKPMRKHIIYLIQRCIEILLWLQAKADPSILQPIEEAPAVWAPSLSAPTPEWTTPTHELLTDQEFFDLKVRDAQAIRDRLIAAERQAEVEIQAKIRLATDPPRCGTKWRDREQPSTTRLGHRSCRRSRGCSYEPCSLDHPPVGESLLTTHRMPSYNTSNLIQ